MNTGHKMAAPLITLDRVTARIRDRRFLPDTSWTIRAGQSWAVIGPNGAGKSTLAGILLDTVPCVSGRVVRHVPEARPDRIGHVSFELLERFAAKEARREEARQFSGRTDSVTTVRDLIESALERSGTAFDPQPLADLGFDIAALLDRDFTTLSSGELRKVLIARALALRPRLLVLDEPFEGLDGESKKRLRRAVSSLIRNGTVVVLVTHRRESLVPEISHTLVVSKGRVRDKGPKHRVLDEDRLGRFFADGTGGPGRSADGKGACGRRAPQGTAPPLVEMNKVRVAYGGKAVLENVDWTVRKGEHWAVLGPNGAGKTTLLSLIAGDHPQAYANRIYLFGKRRGTGESIWEIKQRISSISPELQLRYRKPVAALDVVLSGFTDSVGLYRRVTDRERAVALHWLGVVGLQRQSAVRFDRLSYGERRRVLLARCLVKAPELLILDEPCQGLDPQMRRRFLALLDRVAVRHSPSIVYVTHEEKELPACIDRILRLAAPA